MDGFTGRQYVSASKAFCVFSTLVPVTVPNQLQPQWQENTRQDVSNFVNIVRQRSDITRWQLILGHKCVKGRHDTGIKLCLSRLHFNKENIIIFDFACD